MELSRAEDREEADRLLLSVVVKGQPIADPVAFVRSVVDAGMSGEPVQSRETFDDLAQTGRLRLIRDPALRRQLTDYYQFIDRRSQSYSLQRQRVWGDYLPLSVAATPLALQEWSYGARGRLSTDVAPPTLGAAEEVAARLRSTPGIESALKGVVRSSWSLTDNWTLMQAAADSLLTVIETKLPPGR